MVRSGWVLSLLPGALSCGAEIRYENGARLVRKKCQTGSCSKSSVTGVTSNDGQGATYDLGASSSPAGRLTGLGKRPCDATQSPDSGCSSGRKASGFTLPATGYRRLYHRPPLGAARRRIVRPRRIKRMRTRHQEGWVEERGTRQKRWYGHYYIYEIDASGKETRRHI